MTEAIEVVKMAKDAHWGVIVSHRSGETDDSFIADFSVGVVSGQFKAGAPSRGERLAKYNQVRYFLESCLISHVLFNFITWLKILVSLQSKSLR